MFSIHAFTIWQYVDPNFFGNYTFFKSRCTSFLLGFWGDPFIPNGLLMPLTYAGMTSLGSKLILHVFIPMTRCNSCHWLVWQELVVVVAPCCALWPPHSFMYLFYPWYLFQQLPIYISPIWCNDFGMECPPVPFLPSYHIGVYTTVAYQKLFIIIIICF